MSPRLEVPATVPIRRFVGLLIATVFLAGFLGQLLATDSQRWRPVVGGIVIFGLMVGVVGAYTQRRRRRMPNEELKPTAPPSRLVE